MNGACSVSGSCTKIAASNPTTKTAVNHCAIKRMIRGGGSCGNISDSESIEPGVKVSVFIRRFPFADWTDRNTSHAVPSAHRAFQFQQRFPFPEQRLRRPHELCSAYARLRSWCGQP